MPYLHDAYRTCHHMEYNKISQDQQRNVNPADESQSNVKISKTTSEK